MFSFLRADPAAAVEAASQADAVTLAVISAIVAVFTAIVGVVGTVITSRRIGRPNGKGNIVQMNETQLLNHIEMIEAQMELRTLLMQHLGNSEAHGGHHVGTPYPPTGH